MGRTFFIMGHNFSAPGAPQEQNVAVSFGKIRLPPIVSRFTLRAETLEIMFEGYETIKYHILWQPTLSKGVRRIVDCDIWPKKGWLVFGGF